MYILNLTISIVMKIFTPYKRKNLLPWPQTSELFFIQNHKSLLHKLPMHLFQPQFKGCLLTHA